MNPAWPLELLFCWGCQVNQPALTRVPKAEDELGGLLFSRGPSNIHTAELGSLIEPHLSDSVVQAGMSPVFRHLANRRRLE